MKWLEITITAISFLLIGILIGFVLGMIFGSANTETNFCYDNSHSNYIYDDTVRQKVCR
jgi:hypothetical protein